MFEAIASFVGTVLLAIYALSAETFSVGMAFLGVGAVILALLALLYFLLARALLRSSNVARLLTFIVQGLVLLYGLLNTAASGLKLEGLAGILVGALVPAAVIVLLLTKTSRTAFAQIDAASST